MCDQRTETLEDILVVDDSPADLRLLSQMLSEQEYSVRAVTSGPRALASALAIPPDLILLDVRMPGMNGYEVCQHLKANEQTYDIPIIFISALDETEDKIKGFAAGGVDYITKPFQFEEVLARVETHLSLRHLQKHSEQLIAAKVRELAGTATGIAHELNQLLTAITSDTDHIKAIVQRARDDDTGEKMDSSEQTRFLDELYQTGESLEQSVAQCRRIIDDLLSFGRDS